MVDMDRAACSALQSWNKGISDDLRLVFTIAEVRTLRQHDPSIVQWSVRGKLKEYFDEAEELDPALPLHLFQVNGMPHDPRRPDIRARLVQRMVQLDIDGAEGTAVQNLRDMPCKERNEDGVISLGIAVASDNLSGSSRNHG